MYKIPIFILLTLLSSGCELRVPYSSTVNSSASSNVKLHKVKRVIDGDTIILDNDIRVRLACINTPEIASPGQSISTAEEGSYEAKTALEELIKESEREVYVQLLGFTSYNREIGHIFSSNRPHFNLGLELVNTGHADYHSRFEGCENRQSFEHINLN